jgi:dihydroneopterin aldolase
MHTVFLEGLELYAYHGVSDEERKIGHRYVADLFLEVEGDATETDRIEGTADYAVAGELTAAVVSMNQVRTLEYLAARIADELLSALPRIRTATVRIGKRLPPTPLVAEIAGVEVVRTRAEAQRPRKLQ